MSCRNVVFLLAWLPAGLSVPPVEGAEKITPSDEALLKEAKVAGDGPGLLRYFRERTLTDQDRKRLERLVRQLGSKSFRQRQRAHAELVTLGPVTLPFLKAARKDPDLEVAERVAACIGQIEAGPGSALPAAAARALAVRRPAGAVAALLDYLPFIEEEWLEDEVLLSLGNLAVRQGNVDLLLVAALDDKRPVRRAAAAYLLGRMGGEKHRAAVRRLLTDTREKVRRRAAQGLVGKEAYRLTDNLTPDRNLLDSQGIGSDAAALTAFFRKRSLTEADRKRLRGLVRQLGHPSYKKRRQAEKEITAFGSPSLAFLAPALQDKDEEAARLAERCIAAINRGPGMALAVSAVRLLVKEAPPRAVPILLTYVPSAEEEFVEETVLAGLCLLSARQAKLDPALRAALRDPAPARRAAAAYVLGRVGTSEDCRAAHALLKDADAGVRLRAAQGLLFAQDAAALPVLLKLLDRAAGPDLNGRAEEVLCRVAGKDAPNLSVLDGTAAERDKARRAWDGWWRAARGKVDLSRLGQQEPRRDWTVVCEFEGARGGTGQALVFDRDFKLRWKIADLHGPTDAHVLPRNRLLIAENKAYLVTERDSRGHILWQHAAVNPVACQRLPGGNTFIATATGMFEVTRDRKVVFRLNPQGFEQVYSAQKLANGNVVYLTSAGAVVEYDPSTRKEVTRFQAGNPGGTGGVEKLTNGRYLVALPAGGRVIEFDARGHKHWETSVRGAHQSLRLANGHTLVVSTDKNRLIEVDGAGKVLWQKTLEGKPGRVDRR
jgi:HEAT repeat protein